MTLGVGHEVRARAEVPVPPGRHDPEVRRERGVRQLEPHLVVPLAGRAVGHRVGPLGAGAAGRFKTDPGAPSDEDDGLPEQFRLALGG